MKTSQIMKEFDGSFERGRAMGMLVGALECMRLVIAHLESTEDGREYLKRHRAELTGLIDKSQPEEKQGSIGA